MTYGELKTRVKTLLNVDGASAFDFENESAEYDSALKQFVNDFVMRSYHRFIEWSAFVIDEGATERDFTDERIWHPVGIRLADYNITEVPYSLLGWDTEDAPAAGRPTAWARTMKDFIVKFDREIDATTAAATTNKVRGWAAHSDIDSDDTPIEVQESSIEALAKYCAYKFLESGMAESVSEMRMEMYRNFSEMEIIKLRGKALAAYNQA